MYYNLICRQPKKKKTETSFFFFFFNFSSLENFFARYFRILFLIKYVITIWSAEIHSSVYSLYFIRKYQLLWSYIYIYINVRPPNRRNRSYEYRVVFPLIDRPLKYECVCRVITIINKSVIRAQHFMYSYYTDRNFKSSAGANNTE